MPLISIAMFGQKQSPPEPQPLETVHFPQYETATLSNGLTVYAIEHREQPVVAIRLLIGTGAANEPEELPGLASFSADLLDKGTTKRTAEQIAEAMDSSGGALSVRSDAEGVTIAASVLTDSLDLAFELMTDILMNPAFAEEEIGREREMALSSITAALEDPDYIADTAFNRVLYGTHPYAHPESGTFESISKISRHDIVKFHQEQFAPNISSLAIVGDLSTKDAFALAAKWFGPWQRKDVTAADIQTAPKRGTRRVVIIDKPDTVQTKIRIGLLGVPRKDPDYFTLLVGSYVLGGHAGSRLFRSLRVERGLTYGAYSTLRPRKGPGSVFALTETRTEKTAEAIDLIFKEMHSFSKTEVPAQELSDAKAFLIGSFPLSIETPADLASRLTNVAFYELGDDYLDTYRDKLAAVSAENILRAARERLNPEAMDIVLVGNASVFKADVEKRGKVEVIPFQQLDLSSPTLLKRQ